MGEANLPRAGRAKVLTRRAKAFVIVTEAIVAMGAVLGQTGLLKLPVWGPALLFLMLIMMPVIMLAWLTWVPRERWDGRYPVPCWTDRPIEVRCFVTPVMDRGEILAIQIHCPACGKQLLFTPFVPTSSDQPTMGKLVCERCPFQIVSHLSEEALTEQLTMALYHRGTKGRHRLPG
jgi:hypothetical protein